MLDFVLALIPGGGFTLAAVGAVAFLAFIWRMWVTVKNSGVEEQKAKEAEAREKELTHIVTAGSAKPVGSVHDDPNNRDNKASVSDLDTGGVQRKKRQPRNG